MSEQWDFIADMDSFMYSKRGPMPGAWLAPMQLPGLRGFWANAGSKAVCTDLSCISKQLESGRAAGVDVDISTTWPGAIAPYSYLPGAAVEQPTTWYASNCPDLSITTALTIGGWFKIPVPGAGNGNAQFLEMCWAGSQDSAYYITRVDGSAFHFRIYGGAAAHDVGHAASIDSATWYFVTGRFIPSTSIEIGVDSDWAISTSSIPATIGPYGGAETDTFFVADDDYTGAANAIKFAQCWVCAYNVLDYWVDWLYKVQAPLFGKV